MRLIDRIYGEITIKSPAIIALIKSKSFQRLKKINQFGIPDEYYHLTNYTRYEHSVGVMILLSSLNALEEEQIAGLLHDISHTAFSHVYDWVIGSGGNETYQDNEHENFVAKTEIPNILKQFGYSQSRIVNYHNFRLLEKDIPDLCADRIDYSLREFPPDIAKHCFAKIINYQNQIVMADKVTASLFARNFLKIQTDHWGGFEAVARYRLFANVLKKALTIGIIKSNDFLENDRYVLNKLTASRNLEIQNTLSILSCKSLSHLPKSAQLVHKKFRYIDPLYIARGSVHRLSETDAIFRDELKKARKLNLEGIYVPEI